MKQYNKIKQFYPTLACLILLSSGLPSKVKAEVTSPQELFGLETSLPQPTVLAQNHSSQLTLDPNLVGLWIRSNSQCSYGTYTLCSASDMRMLIQADGTFYQGGSKYAGGGAGGTFSGESNQWHQAEWATANSIVYGRADSSHQWTPVARYYIENGSMLLTFGDGTREIWQKR